MSKDLQKKKHRTGDIYWNRVIDSQTTSLPVSSLSVSRTSDKATDYAIDVPQVPHIRTTSPEEDLLSEHASIEAIQRPLTENEEPLNTSEHPKSPDSTNLRESSLNNPNVPRSSAGPRRFHFIKNTSFTFPRTIDPANRVQKQRKKRRSDLPVFVEKSKSKYQLKTRTGVPPRTDEKITKDHANNSPVLGVCEERPRKRPMVSAAEQQWRTANWSNSTKADRVSKQEAKTAQVIDAPSSQWDYSSETLAGQLQQVALQEINLRTAVTEDDKTAPQLKVQPKSPKARQSAVKQHVGTSSEDESMTDLAENENDHNYIYDTYVRSIAQPPGLSVLSSGRDPGPLQATDDSKIGILIIAEEDQEEWETFAEVDQDSDKDWNSEEEDENGTSKAVRNL